MFRVFLLIVVSLLSLPSYSQESENSVTTDTENEYENLSLSRVESNSRGAAVKVQTHVGHGSGTYTVISGFHVVFTAAHVVDDFDKVSIVGRAGESIEGTVVYRDVENDFAAIMIEEMTTREPVSFKVRNREYTESIGDNICYTGFPNRHDLLTIRGSVAGYENGYLMVQSYTWMGASGSGVFDMRGNYIGTLVAVDLGRFRGTLQIVESVVWVVPVQNLDLAAVTQALRMHSTGI